jgi:hypothetical protein
MRMARGLNLGIGELGVMIVLESMGLVGRVVRKGTRKLVDRGWCLGLRLSDLISALWEAKHQSRIRLGRR